MEFAKNTLLKHIYINLALPNLIASVLLFGVVVFAILTGQSFLYSAMLGTNIGVLISMFVIMFTRKKNKSKLTKRKQKISIIFDSYANKNLSRSIVVLYIIITCFLIYKFNIGNLISIDNFIFYLVFSYIITINMYFGVGFYTAWLNYRKINHSL